MLKPLDYFNYEILPSYGLSATTFAEVLQKGKARIRGSAPLQALLNVFWHDADIDIFVPSKEGLALLEGYLIACNYSCTPTANDSYSGLQNVLAIRTYKYPTIRATVQIILYDVATPLIGDFAAANLEIVDGQLEMHGADRELLQKRITYMMDGARTTKERIEKYSQRGFTVMKSKPVILEREAVAAPLMRLSADASYGRYFDLD
jgi:hypothetical protein